MATTISPSKCPILLHCGQAAHPDTPIGESSTAASMGTAAHYALAQYVQTGQTDPLWDIASRYGGLDEEELSWLVYYGRQCWDRLRGAFPMVEVERRMECEIAPGVLMRGDADVMSMTRIGAVIMDWKTSLKKSDVWAQLSAYAVLVMDALGVDTVTVIVAWLRLHEYESRTLTRAETDDFRYRLLRSIHSPSYQRGDHCTFCPRRYECPAIHQMVSASVGQLNTTSAETTLDAVIGAGKLADFYDTVKAIEAACKQVRDGLRLRIEKDGPIQNGGKVFSLREYEAKEIELAAGWPVLEEWLGDDKTAALKLVGSAAEKIVGQRSTGPKYKAVQGFYAALEESGALRKVKRERMEVRGE